MRDTKLRGRPRVYDDKMDARVSMAMTQKQYELLRAMGGAEFIRAMLDDLLAGRKIRVSTRPVFERIE